MGRQDLGKNSATRQLFLFEKKESASFMKPITSRPWADGLSAAFPVCDALHLVLVDKPCIPFCKWCDSSPMNPLHLEIPLEEIPWGKPQHSGEFSAHSQSINPALAAPGQEPTHTHLAQQNHPVKLLPVLLRGFEPSSTLGLKHFDSQDFARQHPLSGDDQGLLNMSKAPAMFRLM